jgi:hypothetical protein
MLPLVNKWLDLADRAGWTAIQVAAASAISAITVGMDWEEVLVTTGVATLIAVCKVVVGQNTGTDDTGSLIGTSVIEPPPVEKP